MHLVTIASMASGRCGWAVRSGAGGWQSASSAPARACVPGGGVRIPVSRSDEDQAERVDVGAVIDGLASSLLGRHVLDGADDGAARRCSSRCRSRDSWRSAAGGGEPSTVAAPSTATVVPAAALEAEPFRAWSRRPRRRWSRPAAGAAPGSRPRGRCRALAVVAPRRQRDAEVHDQRMVFGVDHDVGRLEVAMHDAGLVRRHRARMPPAGRFGAPAAPAACRPASASSRGHRLRRRSS